MPPAVAGTDQRPSPWAFAVPWLGEIGLDGALATLPTGLVVVVAEEPVVVAEERLVLAVVLVFLRLVGFAAVAAVPVEPSPASESSEAVPAIAGMEPSEGPECSLLSGGRFLGDWEYRQNYHLRMAWPLWSVAVVLSKVADLGSVLEKTLLALTKSKPKQTGRVSNPTPPMQKQTRLLLVLR